MMGPTEHKPRSRAWRLTLGILNIFLPMQETTWYLRSSRKITENNAKRIRTFLNEIQTEEANVIDNANSLDWQAAVAATGKTAEALERVYLFKRRLWRVFFWIMALLVPLFTMVPLFLGHGISSRQVITGFVLFSGAGVAWSRALVTTFRLWQLRNKRVSQAEGGTFRHYLADNDGVRGAIFGD